MYRHCRQFLGKSKRFSALLTAFALLMITTGCIRSRPCPLLIAPGMMANGTYRSVPDQNLKLVTFNVWGLPSWMSGAKSGRYPRIARELERLDPDIVLLQEVWTANARKSAPADGRWSIARAARQHNFFQQSGLVTLSKFPIIGGEFYPFSRSAFPDRWVRKGALKVTVQLPGGEILNIWNVHLQNGDSHKIRRLQVEELLARVEAAPDGQVADLIGGDFNCTPASSLFRELSSKLGQNLEPSGGAPAFVTWDGLSSKPGCGQTLDYLFLRTRSSLRSVRGYSRQIFVASRLDQRLSDHFGVEAVVGLSSAPQPVALAESGNDLRVAEVRVSRVGYGGSD
jgi:endonuclease/exonuclease/phosphatase family metal-dependent hydrolase